MMFGLAGCIAAENATPATDVPLDMTHIVNRGFYDPTAGDGKGGWTDQGPTNSIRQITPGEMDGRGVRFSIINPRQNDDRTVAVFNGANMLTELNQFTLAVPADNSRSVRALYLLHTLAWVGHNMEGQSFGTIAVNYPRGDPLMFKLTVGRDAADWWGARDLPNGAVAYRELNGESRVGLYLSRFELPADRGRPQSVTFVTSEGPTWIIVAATVSDLWRRPLPLESGRWVAQADEQWKPYDQSDVLVRKGTALDFSSLVEPGPAGRHGFVIANDHGRLAFADDPQRPVRFLCAAYGMIIFPYETDQQLEQLAEQLARGGYNAFRPHMLDAGLMYGSTEDLIFNPKYLDRWDRLSAILKKHGIYLYLDLTSSQTMFRPVLPWTPEGRAIDMKILTYFDPEAQEHWKRGVRQLLEHVNPYTGVALKDEPQVLAMELRNEAGIRFDLQLIWNRIGKNGTDNRFMNIVMDHFHQWLKERHGTTEKLRQAWTVTTDNGKQRCYLPEGLTIDTVAPPSLNAAGPDTADLMRFFTETEQRTYAWMTQYVRDQIGVHVLLNDFNNDTSNQATMTRAALSLIDTHGYHDHPSETTQPGSRQIGSSLIEVEADAFCRSASLRQVGKPVICTEWGQPFWNAWRHESGLVFPAYAALQDWNMLTQHGTPVWLAPDNYATPLTSFRFAFDPPLRAAERMSALLFERGDVAASSHLAQIDLHAPDIYQRGLAGMGLPGNMTRLALVCGLGVKVTGVRDIAPAVPVQPDITLSPTRGDVMVRMAGAEQVATPQSIGDANLLDTAIASLRRSGALSPDNKTDPRRGIFQSDTNQLTLSRDDKLMIVNTPRSQGATLAKKGQTVTTDQLELTCQGAPAAVLVSSLTDQPLRQSDRLLLIIATDALNTDMTFTDRTRTELVKQGRMPILMRTTKLTVSLQHDHPDRLTLWALAANGTRVEQVSLRIEGNRATATIDTAALKNGPTPYFEWTTRGEVQPPRPR
ncbi:MAG: hypothetical protein ACYC26_15740 [Phycisphaerales bacterium]